MRVAKVVKPNKREHGPGHQLVEQLAGVVRVQGLAVDLGEDKPDIAGAIGDRPRLALCVPVLLELLHGDPSIIRIRAGYANTGRRWFRTTAGRGGDDFFRGSRSGDAPSFTPRPTEFRVDSATGYVKPSHGVSLFDNPTSLTNRGFTPNRIDPSTVSEDLTFLQWGQDPRHFEIVPRPEVNRTPDQYTDALCQIPCFPS
jgi:hypothetical protein